MSKRKSDEREIYTRKKARPAESDEEDSVVDMSQNPGFIDAQVNSWPLSLTALLNLVSELIPKLRFHYISLHWVSDYLPVSLNQERF